MPKVAEAYLEARRQQVLEAATVCFARKGFHQSTMQDICSEADLSPGAVYRYFSSKEEIIQAITDTHSAHNLALLEAAGQRENTFEALEDLAAAFFAKLDDPQMCALDLELWAETQHNHRIREIFGQSLNVHREACARIVRRAQERGEIDPSLDAESVARAMISLFEGLVLQQAVEGELSLQEYVRVVLRMLAGLSLKGNGYVSR